MTHRFGSVNLGDSDVWNYSGGAASNLVTDQYKPLSAMDFQGGNDFIYTDGVALTGAEITLSCWFKFDSLSESATLMSQFKSVALGQFLFRLNVGSGAVDLFVVDADGVTIEDNATTTGRFDDSKLHHALATRSDATGIEISIDGVRQSTQNWYGKITNFGRPLQDLRMGRSGIPHNFTNGFVARPNMWDDYKDDAASMAIYIDELKAMGEGFASISRNGYNYILEVIADSWNRPASFGAQDSTDINGIYRVVDNKTNGTAASYGYETAHVFPSAITDICPNAPDCTHGEFKTLARKFVWNGQ